MGYDRRITPQGAQRFHGLRSAAISPHKPLDNAASSAYIEFNKALSHPASDHSLKGEPMNDFSKKTVSALARKGISLIGLTVIPNSNSDMPFATGERGYRVNDNGCGRILSFSEILEAAR